MTRAMMFAWPVQLGKPRFAFENFSGGERPITGKGFLQLRNDRALHTEVQVLNGIFGMVGKGVSVPNIHPTSKSRLAIDHQDLRWLRKLIVATRHGVSKDAGRNLAQRTPRTFNR